VPTAVAAAAPLPAAAAGALPPPPAYDLAVGADMPPPAYDPPRAVYKTIRSELGPFVGQVFDPHVSRETSLYNVRPIAQAGQNFHRYPVKISNECLYKHSSRGIEKYRLGRAVGAGMSGDVYELCKIASGVCDRVLKIVPIGPTTFEGWLRFEEAARLRDEYLANPLYQDAWREKNTKVAQLRERGIEYDESYPKYLFYKNQVYNSTMARFQNEIRYLSAAYIGGVGPKIYDSWVCDVPVDVNGTTIIFHYGFIITEKFDETLYDFLRTTAHIVRRDRIFLDQLKRKVSNMYKKTFEWEVRQGIYNTDLHGRNIFLKLDPARHTEIKEMVIGDWGRCKESSLDIARDQYNRISEPARIEAAVNELFTSIST
jgi:hypothetical protein